MDARTELFEFFLIFDFFFSSATLLARTRKVRDQLSVTKLILRETRAIKPRIHIDMREQQTSAPSVIEDGEVAHDDSLTR